jgi:hypothetical protein
MAAASEPQGSMRRFAPETTNVAGTRAAIIGAGAVALDRAVKTTMAEVLTSDELAVLDVVAMKQVSGGGATIDANAEPADSTLPARRSTAFPKPNLRASKDR